MLKKEVKPLYVHGTQAMKGGIRDIQDVVMTFSSLLTQQVEGEKFSVVGCKRSGGWCKWCKPTGEVLALRAHCVHTAHAEAEMGRVRFPKLQSNLWCDLLTVQWPK